jgi:hypothetical protein
MRKLIYLVAFTTLLLSACEKSEENEKLIQQNEYLKFSSKAELLTFLSDHENNTNLARAKKISTKTVIPDNFYSINEMSDNYTKLAMNRVKSMNENDIEEMTVDEYNLMIAKSLLVDPILYNVMDTTLRIGVDGIIYKITKDGTFFAPYSLENKLTEKVRIFSEIRSNFKIENNSQIYDLGDGVKFVYSFAFTPVIENRVIEQQKSDSPQKSMSSQQSDYVSTYGLVNEKWGYEWYTLPFYQWVFGKDEKKECMFDNDTRKITVELFNVNYVFYTSAGLKAKVFKKKKFLFTYYWVDTPSDKLVIGFDKFDAVMTYNAPPSNINPLRDKAYSTFAATFNGIAGNLIFRGYHNIDFVEDWTNEIMSFVPTIEINGNSLPTDQQKQKFFDTPANLIYAELKKLTGKYIFNPIKKQIKTDDPKIAYLEWGSASVPIKTFLTGVQEYSNVESKTIRFNQSAGFYFLNGVVTGYLPTTIAIKDIQVFAAANDGGQWKGIRFYK